MRRRMSDEQSLLAALWPLAGGRVAREAEVWGVRLPDPEASSGYSR